MVGLRKTSSDNGKNKNQDTRVALKNVLAEYGKRHDTHILAEKLTLEYPTLMRKMNPNDEQDIHACQLVKFIEATKHSWKDPERRENGDLDFTLLDEVELRLGRIFSHEVKKPRYDVSFHGLSQLMKESSEATRAIAEAFADGKVTPREAEKCIKELHDLVYIAMRLIRHLEEIELTGKDLKLTE